MAELDWLRLAYLVGVLVLIWPAVRVIRHRGEVLLQVAIWLGVLTAIIAGYVLWHR